MNNLTVKYGSLIMTRNLNGVLHNEDGPAIEYNNGHRAWYINGKRHRLDGPAIEYLNGSMEWYINGKYVNKQDFPKHPAVIEYKANKAIRELLNG